MILKVLQLIDEDFELVQGDLRVLVEIDSLQIQVLLFRLILALHQPQETDKQSHKKIGHSIIHRLSAQQNKKEH